jgi:hypothetical protein
MSRLLLCAQSEIGTTGAEPSFQAGEYYSNVVRSKLDFGFDFPCFILYAVGEFLNRPNGMIDPEVHIIGAHIGLAGVVWTGRPHLPPLAPTLPMFYHKSDVEMRAKTARYFDAAKKAISELKNTTLH